MRQSKPSFVPMLNQYPVERLETAPVSALHPGYDINQLTHLLPIIVLIETIRHDPGRPLCIGLVSDRHRIEQRCELRGHSDPRDNHNPSHLLFLLLRSGSAAEA